MFTLSFSMGESLDRIQMYYTCNKKISFKLYLLVYEYIKKGKILLSDII